jgi:hypothetical protein
LYNVRAKFLSSIAVCFLLSAIISSPSARAEDDDNSKSKKEEVKFPQVGNDDIFGFTSTSELGDAGDTEFANENDGRVGKRTGSYWGLNSKYEFSHNISADLWVAASGFLARNRINGVSDFGNNRSFNFDGFSFEVAKRLIVRSETNPWGITAAMEPRWGRIDGETGLGANSYGFEGKLFIDRVIVPDTLFWASNFVWAPQWSQDPFLKGNTLIGSTDMVSTALSWQFAPGIYFGAESRLFAQFGRISPQLLQGQALYAGPTFLWKINEKVAVNATLQPQIWGHSSTNPHLPLDLDNFERSIFRFKLAWQLN